MSRQSRTGLWHYATGERGRNRVRVFEDGRTGRLFLECWDHRRRVRVALGHRDQARAKAAADELAAGIATGNSGSPEQVTLAELFRQYGECVTPTKGIYKRRHDQRAAALILGILGAERRAEGLTSRDAAAFIRERLRRGDLRCGQARGRPIRQRVIETDLRHLKAVLRWGVGAGLLERNPLEHLRIASDPSPIRPILSADEYEKMVAVADAVSPTFKLALILAHETGHRIGAISHLRWADLDLEAREACWRGEHDKMRREHRTPLTTAAVDALKAARRTGAVISEWVLPSPSDAGHPAARHVMRDWWRRGEELAQVPRQHLRGWHSLRRQFATELKAVPLPDLAALGGWKDTRTILMCYQRPDAVTMRRALEGRERLARTGS